jgi:bifunctional lysine-specific demethylase and histidyl-hydroxylase MINA
MNEFAEEPILKKLAGLDYILQPLTRQTFYCDWFDLKPLQIVGEPNKFSQLPSISEVNQCMAMGTPWCLPRPPEIYLDGLKVPERDVICDLSNIDDLVLRRPIKDRYERLLEADATIALYGMQAVFPSLNSLCKNLAQQMTVEAEAHLFLSSEGCQGLAPHYDCVDIIVLQISGSKQWQVSSQRAQNPIKGKGAALEFDEQAQQTEIELNAGDVLYLPRGTFHHAVATSEVSLHATIALRHSTGYDVLSSLLEYAVFDENVREYIRFGEDGSYLSINHLLTRLNLMAQSDQFKKYYQQKLQFRTQVGGPENKS